jgi:hypothetical protein
MSSDSDSSDEITLPPELVERDRQLMERNQQLEARFKELLKSTAAHDTPTPTTDVAVIQQRAKARALPPPGVLPAARPSPSKKGIIEVQVPTNVEAVPEVKVDPVPELRKAFHKIAHEIKSVNEQISFVEGNKTKCEVTISKLQAELKKTQIENDRAQKSAVETNSQIENNQNFLLDLQNRISAARLNRIERTQQETEAKLKQSQLDQKVRRARSEADRLQSELNSMPSADIRSARVHAEKVKLQQSIDEQKKAIKQLKIVVAELQRASAHEQKVFDHIEHGRSLGLTPESIERALSELM